MGILHDFLFGDAKFEAVEAYVEAKLDEAADWREQEWAELEARQEHIRDLNDQLLHLVDQAK